MSDKTNKDIFTLFDKKGEGSISSAVLGDYLRAIGYNPTNQLVAEISQDLGNPPRLTFENITDLVSKNKQVLLETTSAKTEDFVKAFQVFDKDNTGKVTVGDIRYMLTSLGEKLSDQEVDELLKGIEVDSDGGIDYRKFIQDIIRQ